MAVGGVVFFYRVFTRPEPIVDLSAFKDVNFAFGSVFSFVMGIGLYGLTYIYPVFLARVRGYDSLMIGKAVFVSGLAMFLTAPIAGMLSRKVDPRVMLLIGFIGFGLGTWSASHITADWDFWELLIPQILRGCSLMLAMVTINNLALGTLPPSRIKNASGLFNLTRNLGGAVGLALINSVLIQRQALHYERLSEHVSWGNDIAVTRMNNMALKLGTGGVDGHQAAIAKMAGQVRQQSLVMSFGDVFDLLTLLFVGLAIFAILMKKPPAAAGGGGGGH
jgi:MFS transporter, DHA2 family, multidrug resistance protein